MKILTGFSDDPKQSATIALEDGGKFTISLEYKPQQLGWFFSILYNDFSITGQRLTIGENILRQFINQLGFGLSFVSFNKQEATGRLDISSDNYSFVLLNKDDVLLIEKTFFTRND